MSLMHVVADVLWMAGFVGLCVAFGYCCCRLSTDGGEP